jgi:hypothetical protein
LSTSSETRVDASRTPAAKDLRDEIRSASQHRRSEASTMLPTATVDAGLS